MGSPRREVSRQQSSFQRDSRDSDERDRRVSIVLSTILTQPALHLLTLIAHSTVSNHTHGREVDLLLPSIFTEVNKRIKI